MGKGDTSGEIKGLIIVITFLSTFFILLTLLSEVLDSTILLNVSR